MGQPGKVMERERESERVGAGGIKTNMLIAPNRSDILQCNFALRDYLRCVRNKTKSHLLILLTDDACIA